MAAKKDLWDREGNTAGADGHPKITDVSQPIFMPPRPELIDYPKYIRLAEGEPKIRVENAEHEATVRGARGAKKPAKAKE